MPQRTRTIPKAPTQELEDARQIELARFKARWRAYLSLGYTDILRRHHGHQGLIERVQQDLQSALYPVTYYHPSPPMIGRNLPGPDFMAQDYHATAEEVDAWQSRNPGATCRRHVAAELAYLEKTFARTKT